MTFQAPYDDFDTELLSAGRAERPTERVRRKAMLAATAGIALSAAGGAGGAKLAASTGKLATLLLRATSLKWGAALVVGAASLSLYVHHQAGPPPGEASPRSPVISAAPLPAEKAAEPAAPPGPAAPPLPIAPAPRASLAPSPARFAKDDSSRPAFPATFSSTAPTAPTAPRVPGAPEATFQPTTLAEEIRLIDSARSALARHDAPAALAALAAHSSRYPSGNLALEREALLVRAGRIPSGVTHNP